MYMEILYDKYIFLYEKTKYIRVLKYNFYNII